ncbi:MAG: hypothetical protein HY717_12255, partial [Planctomycetes bacterium]|nr:hypothetical protein [Planctomycetota bacterium]
MITGIRFFNLWLLAGWVLAALARAALPAQAPSEAVVEMFNRAFIPTTVSIPAGGTVTWVWKAGSHIVASGASSRPEDHPGELFEAPVDAAHPSFSHQFSTPGDYSFFDRLNEQSGGAGTIIVLSDALTFRVGVVDNVYIPEQLFIFEGDTVHWEHEPGEMVHTVTSGRSSAPEDDPGLLFDVESSDQKPHFYFTFDQPMVCPYFCRPHESLGMAGTVASQRKFKRGDYSGDGALDISDPIKTLEVLFVGREKGDCPDAGDVNDDGEMDVTDAIVSLTYLIIGGVTAGFALALADQLGAAESTVAFEGAAVIGTLLSSAIGGIGGAAGADAMADVDNPQDDYKDEYERKWGVDADSGQVLN